MIHRYEVGGRLAFEICRIWEQHRSRYNGKTFPRHRGADGAFYWGAGSRWRGNPNRPLYRQDEALASLRDGSSLIIVEGERDVDALVCAGFEATCSPYGAKCFTEPQAQRVRRAMRGNPEASIRIIADNDEPGIAHALAVYERLTPTSNLRARVTAERPPGGYHDMAEAISADEDILNDW
jgi:DNA primase